MSLDALASSRIMRVEPDWIDYNGHLNMAYYNVLFDRGLDDTFRPLGLDGDYVKARNASFFTVEAHVTYLRELREGDPVKVTLQLLGFDAKRIHAFEYLHHAEEGWLSATSEVMMLHVDMAARRSAPFPDDIVKNIAAMHEAHKAAPRPEQAGRAIAIPRKRAGRPGEKTATGA